VGFTSSAPFHAFVPRLIRAFRAAYPLVALSLEESGTGELVDGLREERIDAAFIRSPVAAAAPLVVYSLLEEDLIAALPAGHGLAARGDEALPLAQLAAETFILYRRPLGPGLYDRIIAACHGAGFTPQVGQEAPRILSTLTFVAAGLGVTIVPGSLQRLRMEGVAYRRLAGSKYLQAPLNLACRRGETSTAIRRFVDLARRAARELRSEGSR
jgi:DNA-binding transcriptional LysR family regulator